MNKILILTSSIVAVFLFDFLADEAKIMEPLPRTETIAAARSTLQNQEIAIARKKIILTATQARAVCVFDVEKDEFIFEINNTSILPLASLTKLMTAVVATDNLLPSTLIQITPEAILQEGDSGLAAGENWRLEDLIRIMLIASSNDAAYAIANSITTSAATSTSAFVDLMNTKAQKIGLKNLHFLNATGLDISEIETGATGTCEDMTKLMAYILKEYPNLLDITNKESFIVNEKTFTNTNKLVEKIPFFLAGKTGFSDLAGGNLFLAVNRALGRPVLIGVLGSTFEDRFNDAEILYNEFIR